MNKVDEEDNILLHFRLKLRYLKECAHLKHYLNQLFQDSMNEFYNALVHLDYLVLYHLKYHNPLLYNCKYQVIDSDFLILKKMLSIT